MLTIVALALASPVQEAREALAAQRPHTLVYKKVSTDEPVLEVTYNGPREASATAFSPEGEFRVSVDATHMRLRLADGSCASFDARALFLEASTAALDLDDRPGPPGSQLIYRATPEGSIDLSTSFQRNPDPSLFSWIADLDSDGVQVAAEEKAWRARSDISEWTVDRTTGHLTHMTIGDDAVKLHAVRQAPESTQPLPRAVEVCPTPTEPALQRMFVGQMRLFACLDPLAALAKAWTALDDAAKADVLARQRTWWRAFFADDLPGWISSLEGGTWRERIVMDMADPVAFRAFRDQLPPAEQPQAVAHWKQAWFGRVGQDLLGGHAQEVRQVVLDRLVQAGTPLAPALVDPVLSQPMFEAALAEAEPLLQAPLVPVVEAGGAKLQEALAE